MHYREVKVGDIIIISSPWGEAMEPWVKRVVGVPGDRVYIKNQRLFINNVKINCVTSAEKVSSYTCQEMYSSALKYSVQWHGINHKRLNNMEEVIIPPDRYFILGDNRSDSTDSRAIGSIHKSSILGEVSYIVKDGKKFLVGLFIILVTILVFQGVMSIAKTRFKYRYKPV
jgi:signal peptidase I